MTTDEEDNYQKQSMDSTPDKTSPQQQIKDKNNENNNNNNVRVFRSL